MAYLDCRPKECRGNRGRRRTSKRSKWSSTPVDTAIRRSLRKAVRQQGQKEIREELGLRQLERDFDKVMQLPRRWRSKMERVYAPILSPEEIDCVVCDALYTMEDYDDGYIMDLIQSERDDDDDSCYSISDNDCDRGRWPFDDMWAAPSVQDPEWRDLWVAGHVDHDDGGAAEREAPYYAYSGEYCDFCHEYNEFCECYSVDNDIWEALRSRSRFIGDYKIHADVERNQERLRAGERYFKQHRRTAHKGG